MATLGDIVVSRDQVAEVERLRAQLPAKALCQWEGVNLRQRDDLLVYCLPRTYHVESIRGAVRSRREVLPETVVRELMRIWSDTVGVEVRWSVIPVSELVLYRQAVEIARLMAKADGQRFWVVDVERMLTCYQGSWGKQDRYLRVVQCEGEMLPTGVFDTTLGDVETVVEILPIADRGR